MVPNFSNAVLDGLRSLGFDESAILRIAHLSRQRLERVRANKVKLTDRELQLIEGATGVSAAQLAASAIEPVGGPYTDLAKHLAKCTSSSLRRELNVARSGS